MAENIKERFLKDVANHKMEILKDDGLYRHVRFKRPNTGVFHFDLITWPGHLAISGDMGDYTFSRLVDMFNFFGTPNGELGINCGYWCEKIKSISRYGSNDGKLTKFYAKGTLDNVLGVAEEVIEGKEDIEEFEQDLLNCDTDHEAYDIMDRVGIDDAYEYFCHKPTFHTEWILYAICWGIMEYEKK